MKKCLLFVLLFISAVCVQAQSKAIDSLQKVLQTQKEDTNKVNTLNALSLKLRQNDDDKEALEYANEALQLAKSISFEKGEADAYNRIGRVHGKQGDHLKAREYFDTALNIMKAIRNKKGMADNYFYIGNVYNGQENYTKALKFFYLALRLAEVTKDKQMIARCLYELGYTYYHLENPAESMKNFTAALKVYQELGDILSVANCTAEIGFAYSEQNNFAAALENYRTALKMYKEAGGTKQQFAEFHRDMGMIYAKQGQLANTAGDKKTADEKYAQALKEHFLSLHLSKEIGDRINILNCYNNLSKVYIDSKDYSSAMEYVQKGIQLADSLKALANLRDLYKSLAHLDSIDGNYQQAYIHYKKHITLRDSIVNGEKTQKSLLALMQYESDKKDALIKAEQLRIRNKQYFFMALLGIGVLIGLLIAYIQWRHNQQKQRANALLQQQKEKTEQALEELKATQAQLIQKEKMASLGELTAGIAHEIQNPLNFVNNFSEVSTELMEELATEATKGNTKEVEAIASDIKQNLQKIAHHGKRADAIVKGMLEHSRTAKGEKQPTDMNVLTEEYLRLAYHNIRAKDRSFNAIVETHFDPSIGKLSVVPQEVGKVLLSLLNNAFYAVNEKKKQLNGSYEPVISVSTRQMNGSVVISVRDNGTGISQKNIDKIYQPFFTTKPTGEGTGLGLSLSYDIITKGHGGELKVDTKEGEYAEFVVQLPITLDSVPQNKL